MYALLFWLDSYLAAALVTVPLLLPITSTAQVVTETRQPTTLLWSQPRPATFRITDVAWSPDDRVVILGEDGPYNQVLLLGLDARGSGRFIPLNVRGEGFRIGADTDGTLWLGGSTNQRSSITDVLLSDAYLARLSRDGKIVWTREFDGSRGRRRIQSLVPLSGEEVLIAGQYGMRNWLARVSSEGTVLWEKLFGLGKMISISERNGKIVAVAFDADNIDRPAAIDHENVSVWQFTTSGQLISQHVIRNDIGNDYRQNLQNTYLNVLINQEDESIYVFAAWSEARSATPLEVIKLSRLGEMLWRRDLPDTIYRPRQLYPSSTVPSMYDVERLCPLIAIVSNGNPVVIGCSSNGAFMLSKLSSQAGSVNRAAVEVPSPPACDLTMIPGPKFAMAQVNHAIWILGVGGHCVWLGQVTLPID
jgi:hypothetical protein